MFRKPLLLPALRENLSSGHPIQPSRPLTERKCIPDRQCTGKQRSRNHCRRGKSEVLHIMSVCVCSLSHPARNAHAPCYILICGLSVSNIFFHIISLTEWLSEKKLVHIKCVFWFSLQILSETFLTLRRNERDIIINVHRFSCTVPVILVKF
jgi:hypothetical protein